MIRRDKKNVDFKCQIFIRIIRLYFASSNIVIRVKPNRRPNDRAYRTINAVDVTNGRNVGNVPNVRQEIRERWSNLVESC